MKQYESFDIDLAMERAGGGIARFIEMAEFFPSYLESIYRPIERAWQDQDMVLLSKSAHKLKGSLGMVGATAAFSLAEELEKSAASSPPLKPDRCYQDLRQALEILTLDLKSFVKDHHAT